MLGKRRPEPALAVPPCLTQVVDEVEEARVDLAMRGYPRHFPDDGQRGFV